jgi:hypothetical protein
MYWNTLLINYLKYNNKVILLINKIVICTLMLSNSNSKLYKTSLVLSLLTKISHTLNRIIHLKQQMFTNMLLARVNQEVYNQI